MVTISESEKKPRLGYRNTQIYYAMIYVVVTTAVLMILNIYCSNISQNLFSQSKKASMSEKCQLAADEISSLDVLTPSSVAGVLGQMESLKVSRLIVTDQGGNALYDSAKEAIGSYVLFPEILMALDGNDVFSWDYRNNYMNSRAATPIVYYGTTVGCVYMSEHDTSQGLLLLKLQGTVLRVTLLLEVVVTLFSIAFSQSFSLRLKKIMRHMRIIQEGDYSQKLNMGGNDELTVLGNEFDDLTQKLQTSEQKRSRFVSDASHELKTPLASIKLLTDSILQYDMDLETVREFVGDIGDEAERLNRMTEKLLSLTRAEGQDREDAEIIYMAPTVRRVARMLHQLASQANITFDLQLEGDCPVLILEDDLYQIVFNLMENGIKYNQPGGRLRVTLHREEENALLEISDTGMGIPEEALPHVFERFYRVDKARSRATGGSGLGLAIVRTIVVRNRGEITVASQAGQGTTFTVSFPAFDTEVDRE